MSVTNTNTQTPVLRRSTMPLICHPDKHYPNCDFEYWHDSGFPTRIFAYAVGGFVRGPYVVTDILLLCRRFEKR